MGSVAMGQRVQRVLKRERSVESLPFKQSRVRWRSVRQGDKRGRRSSTTRSFNGGMA